MGTEPLVIVGLAAWVLREGITPRLVGFSVVALIGVILVSIDAGGRGSLLGVVLTLSGVVACAVYTVGARRLTLPASTTFVVTLQQAAALLFALLLLGGRGVMNPQPFPEQVSPTAWLSSLGSGLLNYAVAFWFWLTGLRHTPAAIAGSHLNLIPLFGIAASNAFLGERLWAGNGWARS